MLLIFLLFSCILAKEANNDSLSSYTSKTYLYLGNSFETRYDSRIDTLKFTWADSFSNGNLIKRYYPAYNLDFARTENYHYDQNDRLIMTVIETKSKFNGHTSVDSIINTYMNDTLHIVTMSIADLGFWKEIWTIKGDTTFMEQIINNHYAFTSREYRDTLNRKHSQIVSPELSGIENIYTYNDQNDLIQITRQEDGITQITLRDKYEYDVKGRVILKETYYGEENDIGRKEITIYE